MHDNARHHERQGSSPLARGLRRLWVHARLGCRIIPARAGFTMCGKLTAMTLRDHPRSRGVYSMTIFDHSTTVGSSPLARVLPAWSDINVAARRIIPARAGFTCPERRCAAARSRGVYSGLAKVSIRAAGSSPLARGLRDFDNYEMLARRIIPARAGFTLSRPGKGQISRDHPRSRGVYYVKNFRSLRYRGSSPLARGLLLMKSPRDVGDRIIPARAGFTVRER